MVRVILYLPAKVNPGGNFDSRCFVLLLPLLRPRPAIATPLCPLHCSCPPPPPPKQQQTGRKRKGERKERKKDANCKRKRKCVDADANLTLTEPPPMSQDGLDLDLDRAWDDVLLLEQAHAEKGIRDGRAAREKRDVLEGGALGRDKGAEVAAEVGAYLGFARGALRVARVDAGSSRKAERLERSLSSLAALAEGFPEENPEDDSGADRLREMRAKFKMCCALLGVRGEDVVGDGAGISW